MKIIEGLKQLKYLHEKADDLINKIKANCALSQMDTPEYGDNQRQVVDGWIQSHFDILKEIEKISLAIQRTNLQVEVTIEIDGVQVTKPISAWILWRGNQKKGNNGLAHKHLSAWSVLGDRGIKEGNTTKTPGGETVIVKIIRYFDAKTRDHKREVFMQMPTQIDQTLEIINATTDLIF